MTPRYQNGYLRELNHGFDGPLSLPKEEGDIMILPDGYRWRIERTPTVGDLLKPGTYMQSIDEHYTSPIYLVVHVTRYTTCTCPMRTISGDKYCEESWEKPKRATRKYHRELTEWSLVVVNPGTRQNKDGKFDSHHFGYFNELVATPDGRILHLFENNDEEVFIATPSKKARKKVKPWQLELL